MPGDSVDPLSFHREIPVDEQDAVAIEKLRSGALPEDLFWHAAKLRRNFFLEDSDSLLAEPTPSQRVADNFSRINFLYIDITSRDDTESNFYSAGLGFDRPINPESVVSYIKALTPHKPTQWLLLSILAPDYLAGIAYSEECASYSSLTFDKLECENEGVDHKFFVQPAKTRSGYCIYKYAGGVVVGVMELNYGSKLRTSASIVATAVAIDDEPDTTSLTLCRLTPVPGDDTAVSISSISTDRFIYKLSLHNLFLLSQHPGFFGQLRSGRGGEHPFIQKMRDAKIPLVAKEVAPEINVSQPNLACAAHYEIEKKYAVVFEAVIRDQGCLDVKNFVQGIMYAGLLRFLLDEIKDILEKTLVNVVVNNIPDEVEEYKKFKKFFLSEGSDWRKILKFFRYLNIKVDRVTKKGLFWDDTERVNLPLREGSMQRQVLALLVSSSIVSKEFFPETAQSDDDEKYWIELRGFLSDKINNILAKYGYDIEMIMTKYPLLVNSKHPCDANLLVPAPRPYLQ